MELHELIARIESAGITVSWGDLQGRNAGWHAKTATIWVDRRLYVTPRRAVSVLAHEWAHAILGHEGPQSEREEERADTVAAGILICPGAYRRLELIHGSDTATIAWELGVTERLVRAFRGVLAARAA